MTTRYYEETPCPECGLGFPMPGGHVRPADNEDGFERCPGPGGQRRELTGVQVVEALRSDDWLADVDHHVPVSKPGRYLIVRLDD